MIDVNALNTLLWAVIITCAVATSAAAGAVTLTWLAHRGRRLRHAASGIRALESHLAGTARDRAAR